MLFKETMSVYSENHTNAINIVCGQNAEWLIVDVDLLESKAVWTQIVPTFRTDILQYWRWRLYVPPKHWYLPRSPHGVVVYVDGVRLCLSTATTNGLTVFFCSLIDVAF
jgi:hypothetical protein